jgi:[acyl-carrier-protein] S-malonyltransferase
MGGIALVFPGQGAQTPGMGKSLYERSAAAREVFELAESIRPGTMRQCFEGDADELLLTDNTQPCLYCADLAAAAALGEAGVRASALAGFSLGELAALAYAGAFTYADGFRLVCARGALMRESADARPAAMVAVLKLDDETVTALCGEFDAVYAVNFNCPGQVVAAGDTAQLEQFRALVKESGGRSVPLATGGGFHSPFMAGASERFAAELSKYATAPPSLPVYANATARPYAADASDAADTLARQIRSPVLWRATIQNMLDAGIDTFIESGPGKTLSGLIKRISPDARVLTAEEAI